jgi:hypothetical protein
MSSLPAIKAILSTVIRIGQMPVAEIADIPVKQRRTNMIDLCC